MRMNPSTRMRRHRGSAMFETVMVLPLVFVILGLVFFFGYAFQREQQQRILARYDAARVANRATPAPPQVPAGLEHPDAMNELFFRNQAQFVDIDWETYRSPAGDALAGLAYQRSTATGELATDLFNNSPRGTRVKLKVDFTSSIRLPESVSGPMLRRSVHPGPAWAYTDSIRENEEGLWVYHRPSHHYMRVERRIRNVFYSDFDRQLDNFTEPATRMVSLIRGMLYAYEPGYRGPTVNYNPR
jgi:Flp pilus assembly protein TadG